ncbi:MAG: two-component system, OmpR family, response regulator [Candidatus Eremiobacteraeota bacterium]|nr:two-component system, OmpR family, response regulator [Candidatus Eremiobacteraeota bacterium]MEA2718424.1 two-component system, OmpR family, response regulator [Candidatus Eremiobacteraeota bacterium]
MRALVVEDDDAIRDIIVRALAGGGYQVVAAATGADGDASAADGTFDVVIVDWNLPGLSGVELVRRLREAGSTTPVLFVTARDAVGDRVGGLDAGADDYLVKPFHIDELLARVRSLVRRAGTLGSAQLSVGGVALDAAARGASVDGKPIALSAREYELLDYLVRNAGFALARVDIEERVWGNAFEASSNVLEVMIGRLRRKLGARASAIETVRGHGYRFRREPATAP